MVYSPEIYSWVSKQLNHYKQSKAPGTVIKASEWNEVINAILSQYNDTSSFLRQFIDETIANIEQGTEYSDEARINADYAKVEGDYAKAQGDYAKRQADIAAEIVINNIRPFVFVQNTPSSQWLIEHNLGRHPSCTVLDSANTEIHSEVQHLDKNKLVINHSFPFSGQAILI